MKKHFLIFATGLFLLSACNSVKAPAVSYTHLTLPTT